MKRFATALILFLFAAHAAVAQAPRADMRPGWLSEAEETQLANNLGAARTVIRNIAIDIFGAQPNLSPADYRQLVEAGVRNLPERLAAAEALNPENDAELLRLKPLIIAATRAGRLAEAERQQVAFNLRFEFFLAETRQRFEAQTLQQAGNWRSAGDLAHAQANWRAAAGHYVRAAEAAPESASELRWFLRLEQALALSEQGQRFDTTALLEAREVIEVRALPLVSRATDAPSWAATQMILGDLLLALGDRQAGAAGLESLNAARAAYQRALEVLTRASNAQGWAVMQMNLGRVLFEMSERQADAAGLESLNAARAAYERALQVQTRTAHARSWATTQLNLGNTLLALGQRQAGAAQLERLNGALAAYEQGLEVITRATDAEVWAMGQIGFGNTLSALGERQAGAAGLERLNAARAAYERALEVLTRATDAQSWAMAQMNLGSLEVTIGDRGGGRTAYQRAINHCRGALEVFADGEYRRRALDILTAAQARAEASAAR